MGKTSKARLACHLLVAAYAALVLPACGIAGHDPETSAPGAGGTATGVAVYALSRGQGVSDATSAGFERARTILEQARARGEVTTMDEQRLGLEGETRVCAQFRDPTIARQTLASVRKATAGIELLNVVVEPCHGHSKPSR